MINQRWKTKKIKYSTKDMILIALLSAISALLMSLEFSIPFMPTFIKLDIAEVPMIIGSMLFGFSGGLLIAGIKLLLKVILVGTTTALIGEIVNLLCCFLYVSLFLIFCRNKKKMGRGLTSTTIVTAILVVIINYCITFPVYCEVFDLTPELILSMFQSMNPMIHSTLTMIAFGLIPFNIFKYGLNSYLAYLLYTRIKTLQKE